MDTGIPIIVFSTMGRKSGKVRKVALMRVEHEGEYALVASKGGAPEHPGWCHNLIANSTIMFQDGPEPSETTVRQFDGDEYDQWLAAARVLNAQVLLATTSQRLEQALETEGLALVGNEP